MTMDGYVQGGYGDTATYVKEHSDGRRTTIAKMIVTETFFFVTQAPDDKIEGMGEGIETIEEAAKVAWILWESNLATRNPLGFATT